MAERIIIGQIDTPLGPFGVVLTDQGLARLTFPQEPIESCRAWAARWAPGAAVGAPDARLGALAGQLQAYFAGSGRTFAVPLDLRGTPFQVAVWERVRDVGYGETRSYAQIAAALGRPQAVRAVGAANGANPVPIVVPCHRVIGRDGRLVGYGGGLDLKRQLLELEGALAPLFAFAR
jgi:O-6-methylguanine DNA methyltransferase